MENKKLLNGFEIPILGIGTHGMGGEYEPDYSKDKECIKAIQEAIKLDYNHIDTAEKYGGGHTEELVGKAIKIFNRKKLFITTKVSDINLGYNDLINSAKNSLKRLGIKYIDLYLIHSPNPKISLKETMKAMDYLIDKKLIKNIGVSNFNIKELEEAQKYTKNKIVANELKYNLWAKDIDIKTIEYCQNNNIIVIAYKPFGRGKIKTEKIKLLLDLSKKYNKTEAQIVLNWLISKKNVVTIFKAISINNLHENLGALSFQITKKDSEKIDSIIKYQ